MHKWNTSWYTRSTRLESGAYEVSLVRLSAKAWVQFLKLRIKILMKLGQEPWGLFHKTLQIRKLRIYSYGQILTVNLLINCQNSVIYGHFVVNYKEESFMEQAPGLSRFSKLNVKMGRTLLHWTLTHLIIGIRCWEFVKLWCKSERYKRRYKNDLFTRAFSNAFRLSLSVAINVACDNRFHNL